MNKISSIIFDLGNVLIDVDREKWIDIYNNIHPGLGSRYYELFNKNIEVLIKYEKGLISDDEFIESNLVWLEQKIDKEKFIHNFSNIFYLKKDVIELLPKLKTKYNLYLLSNTSKIHKRYGWGKYKFIRNFDSLFLSNELHLFKPDIEIYKYVEQSLAASSSELLFIDDLKTNVDAACELGWDTIHFVNYENLLEEFRKREII